MKESRSALTRYDDFYAMLSDKVRHDAYEKAIKQVVKKGDVVLDLGAGTGILGFMALKAGAKKVYLVEKSDSIELAKEIAKQNNFTDKISFINKNSLEVELPEKVDVIVSETLGSFGVDENTLEFMIDARKRFLKEDGKIIPEKLVVNIEPVESYESISKVDFWKSIGGIDFSAAHQIFSQKLMVEELKEENVLAHSDPFCTIDFNTSQDPSLMSTTYHVMKKDGVVHGLGGWFDLQLTADINISTKPSSPLTHWKQAFFPINNPINVSEDDIMEIQMIVKPKGEGEFSDSTFIQYNYRCTQR